MAESTLLYSRDDLRSEMAHYLGWGRDVSISFIGTEKSQSLDACLKSALNRVYQAYPWSFLKPVTSIVVWPTFDVLAGRTVTANGTTTLTATGTTVFYPTMVNKDIVITGKGTFTVTGYTSATIITLDSGPTAGSGLTWSMAADGSYQLPSNYAGREGPLTWTDTTSYGPIPVVNENWIRQAKSFGTQVSRPVRAAFRPRTSDGTGVQRWELIMYPTPDAVYTLEFKMALTADTLTTTAPYPLGSSLLGETLLYACLATAEERLNEDKTDRPMLAEYQRRLASSIELDRQNSGAENMGYNGDRESHDGCDWKPTYYVTVNGSMPP